MSVIDFGLFFDSHFGTASNSGSEWFEESEVDLTAAMVAFNAAVVDVIINGGDYANVAPTDYGPNGNKNMQDGQTVLYDHGTYTDITSAPRFTCIGNHDFDHTANTKADFMTALNLIASPDANSELSEANGDKTYGYYDIGNLRVFVLDSAFNSVGGESSSIPSYVSSTELAWLEDHLTIADAAGKWSVIFMHVPPVAKDCSGTHFEINAYLENALEFMAVLNGHRVACVSGGHRHGLYHSLADDTCVDINGKRILFKRMGPLIQSASSENAGYSILSVDDVTGEWFYSVTGNDAYEQGAREIRWTGAVDDDPTQVGNWDYRNSAGAWVTVDTLDTDLSILFDDDYIEGGGATFIEGIEFRAWQGGVTQIEVMNNWTLPIGAKASSNIGFATERIGLIKIAGAFAGNVKESVDITWFNARQGYGEVLVNGIAGNGGKYIHISNNNGEGNANYAWTSVTVELPDDDYKVSFEDSDDDPMSMRNLDLRGGRVLFIDVHGRTTDPSLGGATISKGRLSFVRSALDVAMDTGPIILAGGSVDIVGTNAANGVYIESITHVNTSLQSGIVKVGYITGAVNLTYGAYQPNGTVRTAAGTSLVEAADSGYYFAADAALIAGDTIVVKDGSTFVTAGIYQPESVVTNIDVTAGVIDQVALVDTTTENTDMVGTDDAATEDKQDIITNLIERDEVFDPAAGTVTYLEKGTESEIGKKDLKDPDGNAVNSTEDIIVESREA